MNLFSQSPQVKTPSHKLRSKAWRQRSVIFSFAILGLVAGLSYHSKKHSEQSLNSADRALLDRATSEGQRAFFPEDGTPDKALAIQAFVNGDRQLAITFLLQSLSTKINDPESRIYLNNLEAADRNPAKIAVSVPITEDPNSAREVLRGVAQAQSEINRASTTARPLAITIADDANQVPQAQGLAKSFVNRSDILGVVGHLASSLTLATADIYDQGKLIAISPVSSAVTLSNKSPYVLRTVPSDAIAARALIDHLTQTLKLRKAVVYFNSQSDYSKSLKGELKTAIEAQGGQMVAEQDLSVSSFSAAQTLEAAKQNGAEAILLATNTGMLDRALQVVQVNQNKLPILAGDDVYNSKTLEVARAQGKGMVLAVPWHILSGSSQSFAARSRQLWGGDVNWRTATAYNATQALGLGLQQAKTREELQQSLTHPGFSATGASRMVIFLPSGDRNVPAQLVKIVEGARSRFGYDFVPIP